jgi:anti-sigma B factor antagonist
MASTEQAPETTVSIVAPHGEIDLVSSRGLASRLGEVAGETGRSAILDLSRVTFMDSVGLGVVLKAANRFHRQGKRLVIVAPPGPVRRLLDFAGVSGRLTLFETTDEATAAADA